ncbi:Maph55 [Matsumuraeses phaseoli granulovirus]|uniref:Maph55 n=1 Tax=Matsumuraeses phaseoli granulovirus TaxID=2760664 RepID=A0AAE7MLG2_9BBAC|nr:Maph55 [Matsumuraeses phaseoli granulovirus]QOD40018.1 Maph55 [Matsumuraeses phaseoli granulovirus]
MDPSQSILFDYANPIHVAETQELLDTNRSIIFDYIDQVHLAESQQQLTSTVPTPELYVQNNTQANNNELVIRPSENNFNPETFEHTQGWTAQILEETYAKLAEQPNATRLPIQATKFTSIKKKVKPNRVTKQNLKLPANFVKCRRSTSGGSRLIQIKVLDIGNAQEVSTDSDDEDMLFSAQYIVHEPVDNVMNSTLSVLNQISQSMFDGNF